MSVGTVAKPDQPGRNQLRFGVDGNPCPNAADPSFVLPLVGDVLFLHTDERPNLIKLKSACSERLLIIIMLEPSADTTSVNEQLDNAY